MATRSEGSYKFDVCGASNGLVSGIGVIARFWRGVCLVGVIKGRGASCNNLAELKAPAEGLKIIKILTLHHCISETDSIFVYGAFFLRTFL